MTLFKLRALKLYIRVSYPEHFFKVQIWPFDKILTLVQLA